MYNDNSESYHTKAPAISPSNTLAKNGCDYDIIPITNDSNVKEQYTAFDFRSKIDDTPKTNNATKTDKSSNDDIFTTTYNELETTEVEAENFTMTN